MTQDKAYTFRVGMISRMYFAKYSGINAEAWAMVNGWFVGLLAGLIVVAAAMLTEWTMDMLAKMATAIWKRFAKLFPKLSRHVATWGWAGLLVVAFAAEEGREYLIALVVVIAAAGSLVATCIHWKGWEDDRGLTKVIRVSGYVFSVVVLLLGVVYVLGAKGGQRLSSIAGCMEHAIAPRR